MDILRKELNQIYSSQQLHTEVLDQEEVERCRRLAVALTEISNACAVITDAACDCCYLFGGGLATLLGLPLAKGECQIFSSSDEDVIYERMHPEDLVEKRMLEYEFFKYVDPLPGAEKMNYKASCRIRIRDCNRNYILVDNSTQILSPSPGGKIWLILCCYDLAPNQHEGRGIDAHIRNNATGEIQAFSFDQRKHHILSPREKEILLLISDGLASKQIADRLDISIHTVNRHRQNILEKLSVGNSVEAVTAARSMNLL